MITNPSPDKENVMSSFYIRVGMNRPTVNTPEAVQGILNEYDVRPDLQVVTENEAGTGVLAFREYLDMLVKWPSAVRVEELPDEPDDEEPSDADLERYF